LSPGIRAASSEAEVPSQGQGKDEEDQGGEAASKSQEEYSMFPLVAEVLV
jgi:hypothetical protein